MGNGNQLITADKALMGGDTNGNKMGMRTPIEIALDIDENGMTTARKLYAFLELANVSFQDGRKPISRKMSLRRKTWIIGGSTSMSRVI